VIYAIKKTTVFVVSQNKMSNVYKKKLAINKMVFA